MSRVQTPAAQAHGIVSGVTPLSSPAGISERNLIINIQQLHVHSFTVEVSEQGFNYTVSTGKQNARS